MHVLQMFYWPLLQDPSSTFSLVLSGDFNSCPEFGVYKLVTEGFLPSSCEDWNSSKYFPLIHNNKNNLKIYLNIKNTSNQYVICSESSM